MVVKYRDQKSYRRKNARTCKSWKASKYSWHLQARVQSVFHMSKPKFISNFLWPEMQFECHQVVSPLCVINKFLL